MKLVHIFIIGCLIVGTAQAQTNTILDVPDTLQFVPFQNFNLSSMQVNLPSSSTILSQEFSFEMMTGGILNIFLSDRSFNSIEPFSLRDYNPTSASDFNSYIYRNYFLIDRQSVVYDW